MGHLCGGHYCKTLLKSLMSSIFSGSFHFPFWPSESPHPTWNMVPNRKALRCLHQNRLR